MRTDHPNFILYILFISALILTVTGCSDDGPTAADEASNGLALILERTSEEQLEVTRGNFADTDVHVLFCYEGEGCEDPDGGSRIAFGTETQILEQSDPDKIATGVIVGFQVDNGAGVAEVVRGESFVNEDGFDEFEPDQVVETSDPFTEGDVVEFTYGETD